MGIILKRSVRRKALCRSRGGRKIISAMKVNARYALQLCLEALELARGPIAYTSKNGFWGISGPGDLAIQAAIKILRPVKRKRRRKMAKIKS